MFPLRSREAELCYWSMAALGGSSTSSLWPYGPIKVLRERVAGVPASQQPLACEGVVSAGAMYRAPQGGC